MQTVKVVVSGAVGAGKSQFIRSVSDGEIVSTERRAIDETRLLNKETTVAIDVGRVAIASDLVLQLFGMPGQHRFDFVWEVLADGPLGFVILVDSSRPETFRETMEIVQFFTELRSAPYLLVANKQDQPTAWSPDELRHALRLPDDVPIVACVATQRDRCNDVLLELVSAVLAAA